MDEKRLSILRSIQVTFNAFKSMVSEYTGNIFLVLYETRNLGKAHCIMCFGKDLDIC